MGAKPRPKQGMTNVDVAALAAELGPMLVGARVDKAYQPAKEQVLLRLRQRGLGRLDLLIELGRFITLVRRPPENPGQPSMVAKILRKDLGNARITAVRQVGFDRLLRFDLERGDGRRSLILEMFGDGNLLLLDPDDDDRILLPMRGMEHGVRRLKRGEPYQAPPGGALPFALDQAAMQAAASEASHDVIRFLALDLGFGPQWAEELCLRAGVDKKVEASQAPDEVWHALHAAIDALGNELARNDLAPQVVHHGEVIVDAVPFPLQSYPSPQFTATDTATFAEALDTCFRGEQGDDDEDADDPRRRRFDEERGKMVRRLRQMESALDDFAKEEADRRADGDTLYACFQEVQATLDALTKAREEHGLHAVAARIRQAREANDPAAGDVLEVRPEDGTATLELTTLDGGQRRIRVDVRKTVQDNADAQYEAAKKAKARQQGARVAFEEHQKRLKDLDRKGLDAFGAAPKKDTGGTRHFWFEHHRWTLTPNGFLAVGGRSAAGNDAVVKKYLRDGDRYVHASIHGAPSVVVRPADGSIAPDVPEADLKVACQFAACSSRAWRQFGAASAYWVTPQQVNKTPRAGEFVPKGAWIVHGRRNTFDGLPMQWAIGTAHFTKGGIPVPIGRDEDASAGGGPANQADVVTKLVGGPPEGLARFSNNAVSVTPGELGPNEAAARIAAYFEVTVEEAQAALPPGPVTLPSEVAA